MDVYWQWKSLLVYLCVTIAFPSLASAAPGHCMEDTNLCFPPNSTFADHGCGCCNKSMGTGECSAATKYGTEILCGKGGFAEFPLFTDEEDLNLLAGVSCLVIYNAEFTRLEYRHTRQFPNLRVLKLESGRLNDISNDVFDATPDLTHLELKGNELTDFPPVAGMTALLELDVSYNMIRSLQPGQLENCINLQSLDAKHNNIRELKEDVFQDNCRLGTLDLSHNGDLEDIEDLVFVGAFIQKLDMSHTKISKVPYEGIRDTLEFLNLEETRNLKRYTAYRGDLDDEYKGRTFPLLRNVSFYYHAHCCQMRDHTYLVPDHQQGRREEAIRSVEQAQGKTVWQVRRARQASSIGSEGITCVNTSSGEVIGNTSVTGAEILTVDEFCSQAAYCNITAICPSGCSDVKLFGSGLGSGESHSEIVCVTPNPSACYSPDTFTSQLQGSLCSPSPTLSIAPPPTPSPTCGVVCRNVVPCPSVTTSAVAVSSSLSPSPSPTPTVCDCDFCAQQGEDKGFCENCEAKTKEACNAATSACNIVFPGICECPRPPLCFGKREAPNVSPAKARGQIRHHSREKRNDGTATETTQPPEDWFFLPNSTDIICSLITFSPSPVPEECLIGRFNLAFGVLSDNPTSCRPQPNDFNPCEDLLGDTDPAGITLRAAIWVVIFLALFGNGLVIAVIVGYNFIVRRNKQENFIMHFLYVNLAVADFIMGVYLFTIAIVDLDTLGHYSEEAIEWQTGPGCGFAGFCAITSTMVSVFTLVVITMERVYTFVNVFSRKKVNWIVIIVVMVFGWLFGITMGMLPLIGISSYSRVAVCLPFDVSETSALIYVASMLIITGLAFVLILFGYIIIGYELFCSPSKRRLYKSTNDKERFKSEVMIGIRMSLLVVTNFLSWFPITLMALTAAFGESLIDISTAKFFIVFVFPVNACLNPILYSIWGKKFRENFCLLLGLFGIFKKRTSRIQSERAGYYIPSTTSIRRSSIPVHLLSVDTPRRANGVINSEHWDSIGETEMDFPDHRSRENSVQTKPPSPLTDTSKSPPLIALITTDTLHSECPAHDDTSGTPLSKTSSTSS